MEQEDLLSNFERDLENLIKRCFLKELYDEDDQFYIAADYDTSCRLNDIVNTIGLEVYGMRITPSEFEITFKFIGSYEDIQYTLSAPKYCRISLKNDGNYEFNLTKSDMNSKFFLTITDNQFNKKNITEQKLNEILKTMSDTLLLYHLKY
jgi:hypothetical protein